MKIYDQDTYQNPLRLSELLDMYYKTNTNGLSLIFKDTGYVEDVDIFLTGCLSNLPLYLSLDSTKKEKELISGTKKFKTLIDFYENKISCQKIYHKNMEGYLKTRLKNLQIITYNILPNSENYKEIKKYLSIL